MYYLQSIKILWVILSKFNFVRFVDERYYEAAIEKRRKKQNRDFEPDIAISKFETFILEIRWISQKGI